jgi:uncharacterized protein (DUF924 family)
MNPDDVLSFWFQELKPADWWKKSHALDALITERFQATHNAACLGELEHWRGNAGGRLAEIIVLDQFSRNIYRDKPQSFASDAQALTLAQHAIAAGADQQLIGPRRAFMYMPFMHSESPLMQQQSLALFSEPGLEANLKSAQHHKMIIDRFGRYPHRNAILGRESTAEEQQFLTEPGSSF